MQITHQHGSTSRFKDDSVSECNSVEKGEIWPPTVPNPPNRWPPNLACVMRFYNYPIRGFQSPLPPLPRAGGGEYTVTRLVNFFGGGALFLFSISPLYRFLRSVWRRFAQGCTFWGPNNKIIHFDPILFFPKTQIFLTFLKGHRQFRDK